MVEDVPRRLKRFYREKPTSEEARAKGAEIAVKKVDEFKRDKNRYPNKDELEAISENVYEQLKREFESAAPNISEDDIDLGEEKKGKRGTEKTLADLRAQRHHGAHDEKAKEKPKEKDDAKSRRAKREERKANEEKNSEAQSANEAAQDDGEIEIPDGMDEDLTGNSEAEETDDDSEDIPKELASEDEGTGIEKLAELDELSGFEDKMDGGDDELIEEDMETPLNNCPRCSNKTEDLIYCPSCGEAFCDHCAKSIERDKGLVKYVCPKCGKGFSAKAPQKK